jgi:hypothetical protein
MAVWTPLLWLSQRQEKVHEALFFLSMFEFTNYFTYISYRNVVAKPQCFASSSPFHPCNISWGKQFPVSAHWRLCSCDPATPSLPCPTIIDSYTALPSTTFVINPVGIRKKFALLLPCLPCFRSRLRPCQNATVENRN